MFMGLMGYPLHHWKYCTGLPPMLWPAYTWMPVALLGIPFVTVTLYRHFI